MRNLKRALSLALASVMLLGMMVVGTSAASYPDVDSNDNVEAIEVLNAVKVMIGDRGNFKPDAPVNRHEMAVIMAKLVLGNEIADNYVGTHPFTDVASWADKYVAACYENGIAAGTSKTTFGGDKPLTAVEAAAFMLRALGYKDLSKGASDWSVPVTAKANEIRLFAGVAANPKQQLDRNQVAQLALNTLKSPVVDLKDGTFDITSGEGNVVISGGSREYIVRASTDAYAQAISDAENRGNSASGVGGYTIELGEHLYNGDLRLNNNATDDFGRPARQWEYNGKTIGTYAKTELLRAKYTTGVTGKTIYDLLGSSIVTGTNRYTFAIYMDGLDRTANSEVFPLADINRSNNKDLSGTGRGVLTEVFVDNDKDLVTISMTNTYLAKADADYSEKRDLASFNVYYLDKISGNLVRTNAASPENLDAKGEDFLAAKDVKKDDIYLVTVADGKIQTLVPAETIADTAVDAFSRSTQSGFVEVAGKEYKYAKTLQYDAATLAAYTNTTKANLKDLRYNVYLDGYQNAIGVKEIEPKKNYVFITGVDSNYSFLAATNYKANAIFLDGTMEAITIDAQKSSDFTNFITDSTPTGIAGASKEAVVNTWCTYTKNSSNVYTVQLVNGARATDPLGVANNLGQHHDGNLGTAKIDDKNYSMTGAESGEFAKVYANDESVFLTASIKCLQTETNARRDIVIDDVDGVATGIDNVKIDVYNTATLVENHASNHPNTEPTGTVSFGSDHRHGSIGSYILFNDKGYILAAVVVGDDGGASSDFVFVHKSDVVERDLGDDKYQWTRTVLVDGEEKVLTEIDDSTISYLERMDQNKWYRVTYKADETVKSVESFRPTTGMTEQAMSSVQWDNNGSDPGPVADINLWSNPLSSGTAATTNVENIEALIQGNAGDDVVVYHQWFNTTYKPTINNARTLHMMSGSINNDGIRISEDVKVWFKEFVDNKDAWDDGSGINYLESVINDLKTKNGNYQYEFAALIEKGRATTVIIRDTVNNYTTPTEPTDSIELDSDASVAQVNEELTKHARVIIKGGNWVPKTSDGNNRLVEIPQGKTLEIKGNFNAVRDNVQVHLKGNATKGTLIVGGTYTMNVLTSGAVHYDIQAGSMRILEESTDYADNRSVEINSKVVIADKLTIQDSTSETVGSTDYDNDWTPEVIITSTGDVTVGAGGVEAIQCSEGAVSPADAVVLTKVDGTLTVSNNAPLHGSYVVGSKHSLHALGSKIFGNLHLAGALVEISEVAGKTTTEVRYEGNVAVTNEVVIPSGKSVADLKLKNTTTGMTVTTVNEVETTVDGVTVSVPGAATQKLVATTTTGSTSSTDNVTDAAFVKDTTPAASEATGTINGVAVSGTLTELVAKAGTATGTSTITLNKSVTLDTYLSVKNGTTLDLGGNTVTGPGGNSFVFLISGGATVKNGTVKNECAKGYSTVALYGNEGKVNTLDNVVVDGGKGYGVAVYAINKVTAGTVEIKNCRISTSGTDYPDSAAIGTNGGDNTGTGKINITGGTISGNDKVPAMLSTGCWAVTVTNATVSGADGIQVKAGSLSLEGTTSVTATATQVTSAPATLGNGMNVLGAAIAIENGTSGYGTLSSIKVASTVTLKTQGTKDVLAIGITLGNNVLTGVAEGKFAQLTPATSGTP